MYPDEKYRGDSGSVAEELLADVPDLEIKCRAVEKAVREGYFTLPDALKIYKVSETEYMPYFLLRNRDLLNDLDKEKQLLETLPTVSIIYRGSYSVTFSGGKSVFEALAKLLESFATKKLLLKEKLGVK
ncbi:MAG: hypothetical protein EOO01_12265 [Chitinophagaceae bacterium]|nr:MAG: hypothetical protein EOO01_12265 [Chitinophagaceae bacterium]